MEAGFGAATAAAGATGADGAMGGFNPAGASGAEGGFGGVRPTGGEGGLSPAGGSGAPPVGAGTGFGGRLIMAFSRGFPAADCPSRRGGRTMRTVSFFGSLINSGVICSKIGFPNISRTRRYFAISNSESSAHHRTTGASFWMDAVLLAARTSIRSLAIRSASLRTASGSGSFAFSSVASSASIS